MTLSSGVLFTLTSVFMMMPLQALILPVANMTTRPMLHKVEYYIDMDKYYFPILIHGYLTVLICVTSIVASDAIFVIFLQHACGLFIIIGYVLVDVARKEVLRNSSLLKFILLLSKITNRTSDTRGVFIRK